MSEIITNGYKRLFEVRLLHHYWLDEGTQLFDFFLQREKRLLAYDCRPFLNIQPTAGTVALIKGLHGVYKNTALGAVVVVPADTEVPDDAVFTFFVTIADSNFNNYTTQTFHDRSIHEIFYTPEEKTYRFKKNVMVLDNTTGSKRGPGPDLFLSKEIPLMTLPATSYPVEALVNSGGLLLHITDENGGSNTLYGGDPVSNLPVFLHQDDIPAIVPPAGMTGAPDRGIQLTAELPDDVFAVIRIRAVHPTDTDLSCTTGGFAKPVGPVFQVRFKNRLSFWHYKNQTNPSLPGTDLGAAPLPLTFFGNASPGSPKSKKPPVDGIKVQWEDDDPTRKIEKIFSEIFT